MLTKNAKKKLISFLRDDAASRDVTSALIPKRRVVAYIEAREKTVLAGGEEAAFIFRKNKCRVRQLKKDGALVKKGKRVMRIEGENRKILAIERTALNVMGRMGGVATICGKASSIAGGRSEIMLTRKVMPGFNEFDKKACRFGGVSPHRKNLADMVLIKENHLKFSSIEELVKRAKKKKLGKIEVEVENLSEAIEAAELEADIIMLDNFSPAGAKKAVKVIRSLSGAKIELSGGINLKNLRQYLSSGADMISMGELTKKAKMADFSLYTGRRG
ncbi:MAG: carboxylating nicotinate-nucleotide diphosphorylase [Candidatus Diapherotrites archaeon]